jgi:hypothetical protein
MAEGLLSPVERQTKEVFGMVPMKERLSLLPRYSKDQGLIAPEFIYELAKAVSTPITAAKGYAVSPEEAINVGMAGMGGGSLGSAPKGSTRSFLLNTPQKPNPVVGTRFEREFLGGLAPKTPVKIEDYKDASLMILPWDSSSRNYRIKSVSDVVLPRQTITHGGQDYARDIEHMRQGIAGASNLGIAERIAGRDAQARLENLQAGGSGKVIHMPATMGEFSENFSVQPIDVLLGIADAGKLSKKTIKEFDQAVRDAKVAKGTGADRVVSQPFKNFKGIMSDEGRTQLYDINNGELRKAVTNRFYLKGAKQNFQKEFGFNAEDVVNAITDPVLQGVPKGYIGNTVFTSPQTGMILSPASNPTYSTNFSGLYQGTLGNNVPVEVLMPKTFERIAKELSNRKADLRTMTLGALEKRKEGVSELIDDRVIESYYKYLQNQKAKGLLE